MEIIRAVASHHGVSTRRSLILDGVTSRQLDAAVRSGKVLRVRRGCYALPNADPVRIAEVSWGAHATCVTALQRHGIPLLNRDTRMHLTFPSHRSFSGRDSRPPRTVVPHFHQRLPLRTPSIAESVDAAALCLSPIDQLVSSDAALNRGLISLADVRSLSVTGAGRRNWLLRNLDPSCQSPLETLTRVELKRHRTNFKTQVQVHGVGRVDFMVGEKLIVEADGRTYHSNERAFAEDRRRDRAAMLSGYRVLRFTSEDVLHRIDVVIEEIQRALQP